MRHGKRILGVTASGNAPVCDKAAIDGRLVYHLWCHPHRITPISWGEARGIIAATPGLPRSGEWERPPSIALARPLGLGSDG